MQQIVNVNIDLLIFLKKITGFSNFFMGVMLLGIGNSVVDLFVDVSLSANGFAVMAITGVYAG